MDNIQKLKLQELIQTNNVQDQTQLIRELKHSNILKMNINNMISIKEKFKNKDNKFIHNECMNISSFLYNYYTDIYNKILNDEIDYKLMEQFLNVLLRIENGELDQHEGSFIVGTILKELYIDSAIKRCDKLDKAYGDKSIQPPIIQSKNISFSQWKILSK